VCFILGYNEEERSLPIWDHPLVMKDVNGTSTIVTDLRKYVKKIDEQPFNISDVIKDKASAEFLVIRTLLTADYIDGNYGIYRNINETIVPAFALVISSVINNMVALNPVERVNIEIVLSHYLNVFLTNSENIEENIPNIVAKILKSKLSIPVNRKSVETIVFNIKHDISNIEDLLENIRKVISEDKASFINSSILVNLLSNIWYGPGGSETIMMGLEDVPTWSALVYVSLLDKSFKRTRLSMLIEKSARKLNSSEFEKQMKIYLKEKIIK
jgi:hypothetical protein